MHRLTLFYMRRFLHRHRWATVSVVLLLLFATSSMALSRMTCLMSGHSVVAFGMLEDCCPEPEPTEGATLAPVCCVFGQAALDVEPFMPGSALEFMPLIAIDLRASDTQVVTLAGLSTERSFGLAPPLVVMRRLALHSTFLI